MRAATAARHRTKNAAAGFEGLTEPALGRASRVSLRYKFIFALLNLALLPVDWSIIQAKPESLLIAHIALATMFHFLVAGIFAIIARRRTRARIRAEWKRARR